jgi:hypothetical protein
VKRSTAIGHLVEMAEVATERLGLRDAEIGWPLEEMWVSGELLGAADTLEAGSVVLGIDIVVGPDITVLEGVFRNPAGDPGPLPTGDRGRG